MSICQYYFDNEWMTMEIICLQSDEKGVERLLVQT